MSRTERTPRGMRLHIGLFGRRNAGKSSLLNALVRQQVSIVSAVPGTTTDPVEKPMELQPLGPVVFIDTAGVDDEGALGEARVARTHQALERTDLAVLVAEAGSFGALEQGLLTRLQAQGTPVVLALSKTDVRVPSPEERARLAALGLPLVETSAEGGVGLDALRQALVEHAPAELLEARAILNDLVPPGELAVLVVPIDKEAPKGRLILPEAQAIRDLLDGDALCLVTRERGLSGALARLTRPPWLVVTDSQAFREVAAATPPGVPLTSFSILFARFKGDLATLTAGAQAIDRLRPGDRVLVAEACPHHPIGEDIGRVKIPRWLAQRVGGPLAIEHVQGRDFPDDLRPYRLVIHCGACTFTRRAVLSRVARCQAAGVPVTNYGLCIAKSLGVLERALGPFPEVLELVRRPPGPRS
jgi:[FeFe] hydrogenase H-cluster maturation GTPase HydF